jgi:hypothetical protein
MKSIRKISVGADYKNAMHYIVGSTVINGEYVINTIKFEGMSLQIWIEKNNEVFLWKEFTPTMPVSIEFNIDF